MKNYILDASVILTFLLSKSSPAEKRFIEVLGQVKAGKAKLHSSHLLPLEVGNGLRYALSDKTLADEIFQKFSNLPIELSIFSSPQLTRTLQLSYLFGVSFYDASYHFLAKFLKGVFLTCDVKHFKKAKEFGYIELV